jgi:hypothetical protein
MEGSLLSTSDPFPEQSGSFRIFFEHAFEPTPASCGASRRLQVKEVTLHVLKDVLAFEPTQSIF